MKFDKGLMAGSSSMLVLSLLKKEDMYGYQMIEQLAKRSGDVFEMGEGTLYPILHAMEKSGYVSSYRQAINGRERKYYHLTERGRKQLDAKKEEWKQFRKGVEGVLSGGAYAFA